MAEEGQRLLAATDGHDVRGHFAAFASLALQVALANITRIALLTIDNAFLGHLGTSALAAASLSSTWIQVPLFSVWAMSSALVTLCGQAYGAANKVLMGVWLQMALLLVSCLALPVMAWYISIDVILVQATDDATVVRLGARFARVMALSVWPTLIYACLRQYLQAMHVVAPTTVNGLAAIGITVGANYVLIYGAGNWHGLGFDGSPLATVIAAWFQPIALFLYAFVYKKYHKDAWGGWKLSELTWSRWKTFFRMALPLGLNDALTYLANSCMSLVVAMLGVDALAANAILLTLWVMLWALSFGVGCATQVHVATALGANRPAAAQTMTRIGLGTVVATTATTASGLYLGRSFIVGVFTSDADLVRQCYAVLPLYLLAYALDALEITLTAVLNGMGQMQFVSGVSFVGMWLVQLPVAYGLAIHLQYGLHGVWVGYAVTASFKLMVLSVKLLSVDWSVMARQAMDAMESETTATWHVEVAVPSPANAVMEPINEPWRFQETALLPHQDKA
ncbi:hypothetical protein SDRG_04753 [Saprolegnia diclina VS20]|uniref:Uncharacterized protein n=1 Tax=Saprolegnia diclina (strain VS20) TaxID=1156394 RepID=T0QSN4_SAPDV|nr:hypothetical protein SDRG_04753 [Saprolegnia diclina VS20]EQC37726.1 hypothetical protein SDRG_04753 [Saprolegnia diclina VS20]|eukprot:XP_008608659.1 hypothetical protein SDRG_04753 [Saprolegnia diclina VS20]